MRFMQWPNACAGSFAAGWTELFLLNVGFLTSNSACSLTAVGRTAPIRGRRHSLPSAGLDPLLPFANVGFREVQIKFLASLWRSALPEFQVSRGCPSARKPSTARQNTSGSSHCLERAARRAPHHTMT